MWRVHPSYSGTASASPVDGLDWTGRCMNRCNLTMCGQYNGKGGRSVTGLAVIGFLGRGSRVLMVRDDGVGVSIVPWW